MVRYASFGRSSFTGLEGRGKEVHLRRTGNLFLMGYGTATSTPGSPAGPKMLNVVSTGIWSSKPCPTSEMVFQGPKHVTVGSYFRTTISRLLNRPG